METQDQQRLNHSMHSCWGTNLSSLCEIIESGLNQIYFQLVPLSKIEYYDSGWFGDKIETRFVEAVDDMREAATCFALGRWTAVAHHCMGVVQRGMIVLGTELDCQLD